MLRPSALPAVDFIYHLQTPERERASKVSFENKIHYLELPLSPESSDGRDPSRARLGLSHLSGWRRRVD
jgi:hypothetical protein